MKKNIVFLPIITAIIILTACSSTETYDSLRAKEQTLIADYIKRNNIKVVSTMPARDKWEENEYYKSSTGLYFHLSNMGDTTSTDTIASSKTISYRYRMYTLDVPGDTIISNMSTIDYPSPKSLIYGVTTYTTGIQEAMYYMKYPGSDAKIIVPSTLSLYDYINSVTPIAYDLKNLVIVP